MLTRNDMFRLSTRLPDANQLAFDNIMPSVNEQIRKAANVGMTSCEIDVPTILDTAPAFNYGDVCTKVIGTLQKGAFTVTQKDIGLFLVNWESQSETERARK